jgi:hypothetical protein
MKISEQFGLAKSQAEIDFIDIDPEYDISLFIDPHLIGVSDHPFSNACHTTITSFFTFFLELVGRGEQERAKGLFSFLHEPNETCLGISTGKPNGRGVGGTQASEIFDSIMGSRAIETGVLEHLEDFRIFVHGVGPDKVSDMTTNIIRKNLIEYTQQQCGLHGIPLQSNVGTGPCWNSQARRWEHYHEDMLVIDGRQILLVPKCIVTYGRGYSFDRYHRHYVLNFVKHEHLISNGPFVQRRELANGREKVWVTKEDMSKHVTPPDKDFIAGYTEQHKHLFENFKRDAAKAARPLSDEEINSSVDVGEICAHLIEILRATPPGGDTASSYHKLVVGILELIFYPNLTCPRKEFEIYEGRKRIDIRFDNWAREGEFYRLHDKRDIPCAYIFVECKNYSTDVANPELDQLSGRLNAKNGKFGLLLCRSVNNYDTLIARCRDAFNAKHELMVPLMDEDLITILEAKMEKPNSRPEEALLAARIDEIVLGARRTKPF